MTALPGVSFAASLLVGLLALPAAAGAGDPHAQTEEPLLSGEGETAEPEIFERLDRIVAVIDEDPIFLSDIEQTLAMNPDLEGVEPRIILDQLIEERLRSHEVDRYGAARVDEAEVERQAVRLERADGPRLEALGVDAQSLRATIRRQLRVLLYVEERLGALVQITDEAVRGYYESSFREEMIRRDRDLPPLAEVQEAIRTLLREQALDRRIDRWTEELRERARIVDLLESPLPLGRLPRSVLRVEPPPQTPPPRLPPPPG
ncbi:MAG: hypothetical protein AAF725_06855 [Acidobacteriota bacterium]